MPRKELMKCYFGCPNDGPIHQFPSFKSFKWEIHQSERLNKWKALLDRATIEKGDDFIQNNIQFCYRHFQPQYRLASGWLTRNAVPSLKIEQSNEPEEDMTDVKTVPLIDVAQPSTAAAVLGKCFCQENSSPCVQHSTEKIVKKPKPIICNSHLRCQKTIAALKCKLRKLNNKCKVQAKKLRAAKNLTTNKHFLNLIENLPENMKIFTKLQMKFKTKPRGRRFTTEEKVMCSTILKENPNGYNLLKQLFVLPSKRSLQSLLSSVTVEPGSN